MSILLFFISAIVNAWAFKLISQPLLCFLILTSCVLLCFLKRQTIILILVLIGVVTIQLRTTPPQPLLANDNLAIHNRMEYMRAYPILPLPIAYWVEERVELRAVGAFVDRTSILFSPNYYFFANHPRERAAVTESEKFPIALLPFFVLGLLSSLKKKNYILLVPVILAVAIGSPLLMYPFIAASSFEGLKKSFNKPTWSFYIFSLFFLISLIVQYVFTIY